MANWYVDSAVGGGAGTGANWANAYTTLKLCMDAAGTVAGDAIWVAHTHAETQASILSIADLKGTAASPCTIMCVDKAGTVPPVAADLRTTASVTTTGAFAMSIGTSGARVVYIYGIIFSAGTGAVASILSVSSGAGSHAVCEQCSFRQPTTSGNTMALGGVQNTLVLKNCTLSFGSVSQALNFMGSLLWDGGSLLGATLPTLLMTSSGVSALQSRVIRNVDFDSMTSGKTILNPAANKSTVYFENCKINSAVTISARATTPGSAAVLIRTDSAETGYRTAIMGEYAGDMTTSVTVVRTGGATDGVTPVSWKMETTANSKLMIPLIGLPLWKFNSDIDVPVDLVVEGVADPRTFTALPTNAEFWVEVSYQGTSGSSLGSTTGALATILTTGTAHTASTEAWDSMATARANSTAYVAGDVIKVASNAGRIFICTTAGTTAGSEPGGYASAVDGGSVTDNTATFKAGWRFKQTVTVTPVTVGAIQAVPKLARASSVVYIDPKLVIPLVISLLTDSVGGLLSSGADFLLAS